MISPTLALIVLLGTLSVFTVAGIWHTSGKISSVEDYITARNSTGLRMITATLIASLIGVWILISAPEAGASFGIAAVVGYATGEGLTMLVYSRIGPRIKSLIPAGHSLTEYIHVRYGAGMYVALFLISLFYMFIFLAAELTGITIALAFLAEVPRWQTAVLVGGFVLLYTAYGGLQASIFTDTVQAVLILPLLLLGVIGTVFAVGGLDPVYSGIVTTRPELLDFGHGPGLRFGLALVFAILGAELINQTWWQRIYAADNAKTLSTGFRRAAVANFTILIIAALLGLIAVGQVEIITDPTSAEYNASIAFFLLLGETFSDPLILAILMLAVLLVMSTADSLFNAMSSLVTSDLPRVLPTPDDRTLTLSARLLTVIVAIAAILVSLRARSVLRLFFLADLFGVAVMPPLVYGLYSTDLTQTGAIIASLAGLGVGLAYFPDRIIRSGLEALPIIGGMLPDADPLYLFAFGGAAITSAIVTLLAGYVQEADFDHDRLAQDIRRLD